MQNRSPAASEPMPMKPSRMMLEDLTEAITSSVLRAVDARPNEGTEGGGSANLRPIIWAGGRFEFFVGLPGADLGAAGGSVRIDRSRGEGGG